MGSGGNKKLPTCSFSTLGIVREFCQASMQLPPQTSSPWCSVCLPYGYGVDSMNRPNQTRGRPSNGAGRGLFGGVLYKLINNRKNKLILQLLMFLTNHSPAVKNGCRNGIHRQRRATLTHTIRFITTIKTIFHLCYSKNLLLICYLAMVMGNSKSATTQNAGESLAILIAIQMRWYDAGRIVHKSTSMASLGATGCCHRVSACAVSPRWPSWSTNLLKQH